MLNLYNKYNNKNKIEAITIKYVLIINIKNSIFICKNIIKCELTIEQRQHLINLTKSMSTLLTEDEFYKIIKIYDDAIIRFINN